MVILGHQFRGTSESDWMMKTSIKYDVRGNTRKILQEIFKESNVGKDKKLLQPKEYKSPPSHSYSPPSNSDKCTKTLVGADDVEKDENVRVTRTKNSCGYIFENFDESQHLNGCPLKWLYHKKLSERNANYFVRRSCSKRSAQKREIKTRSNPNVRDKTPIEVKIHKINLMERSELNYWQQSSIDEPDVRREIDIHRRNLAAKLNWKLHDETSENSEMEISSQISFRHNYLHPRPLWGLKPLLSILLLPHQETSCCPTKIQIQPNSTKERPIESPSLSIKSLELPLIKTKEEPPRQLNSQGRWGSKSHRSEKKLQIPNQITINLRRKYFQPVKSKTEGKNMASVRNVSSGSLKKSSEQSKRGKDAKSLSSLYYELSTKMNYKNENNEYFEDLLRDLTVEDEQFKFQRFFQFNRVTKRTRQKGKVPDENKSKQIEYPPTPEEKSETVNLKCGKASFFVKLDDSKNRK